MTETETDSETETETETEKETASSGNGSDAIYRVRGSLSLSLRACGCVCVHSDAIHTLRASLQWTAFLLFHALVAVTSVATVMAVTDSLWYGRATFSWYNFVHFNLVLQVRLNSLPPSFPPSLSPSVRPCLPPRLPTHALTPLHLHYTRMLSHARAGHRHLRANDGLSFAHLRTHALSHTLL